VKKKKKKRRRRREKVGVFVLAEAKQLLRGSSPLRSAEG
jgi:hypothetical protein